MRTTFVFLGTFSVLLLSGVALQTLFLRRRISGSGAWETGLNTEAPKSAKKKRKVGDNACGC